MIHYLMCALVLLSSFNIVGQNLVPNGSFEDTVCVENNTDPFYTALADWFRPNGATPDRYTSAQVNIPCYFNSIYNPDLLNAGEWQFPKDGQHMVGLWCGNELDISRELIEAKLEQPLLSDSVYCFSMYVSLGNLQNLAIDRIGAFFSEDSVYDHSLAGGFDLPLNLTSPAGVFLTDTLEWIHISGEYIAQGGEEYILIGNAFDDSQTSYISVDGWGNGWNVAYYFFDDISLIPCGLTGLVEENSEVQVRLNLTLNGLEISGPLGMDWEVYDIQGKQLGKGVLSSGFVNLGQRWASGLYIVRWAHKSQTGAEKVYIE